MLEVLAAMAKNDFGLGAGSMSIDIKLDGTNYREWAFLAKIILRAAGSVSHLSDDPPSPIDDAALGKRLMIVSWAL